MKVMYYSVEIVVDNYTGYHDWHRLEMASLYEQYSTLLGYDMDHYLGVF